MKTVLSIAGSDSGGGAGIQADIKTITVNGAFATCAITALTAQNTLGVTGILEVPPSFLRKQIDAVFTDIRPNAVKIGMVSSAELIDVIAERLVHYKAENVVVDPVMVATAGSALLNRGALSALKKRLLPLATLITPNIPEAEALTKTVIRTKADMEFAARALANAFSVPVLLKGGHAVQDANDLLYAKGQHRWIAGKRVDTPNTHGTGCTLSSAIAANLAKGFPLAESVERAKEYISGALAANLALGKGSGPLHHGFMLNNKFSEEAN